MFGFVEGGKPENPEKNPRNNNPYMYGTGPESNWGHIGGRRVLEGILLCYVRARAHERALMTQTYDTIRTSCAVGMRDVILRNHLKRATFHPSIAVEDSCLRMSGRNQCIILLFSPSGKRNIASILTQHIKISTSVGNSIESIVSRTPILSRLIPMYCEAQCISFLHNLAIFYPCYFWHRVTNSRAMEFDHGVLS